MAKAKKVLRKICAIYADYGSKGLKQAIRNKLQGRSARYGFEKLNNSVSPSTNIQSNQTTDLNVERVKAIAPSLKDWATLKCCQTTSNKNIDVIIPVYDGYDETLRCIYSVFKAKTKIAFDLVIIIDKSPNKRLVEEIKRLHEQFQFTLIENDVNQGFVKTTNIGMKLHPQRDVVWLNSDTEVFDYWIDRIIDVAEDNKDIATITPLSNNATLCSYPRTFADNCLPLDTPDYLLDQICAQVNYKHWVEAPTGVGFCMYVRREALNEVGLLDEAHFGKGYGEENDLCQRFIEHGWKNAVLSSVFVRHYGSVSFKASALKRQRDAMNTLRILHPNYEKDVQQWIASDPLRIARAKIDCCRIVNNQNNDNSKRVLLVNLSFGGGTEVFVQDLKSLLTESHIPSLVIRPDKNGDACFDVDESLYPNIKTINAEYDFDFLCELLKSLKISDVHVNHVIGFNPLFADMLRLACQKLGIRIEVTIHDYYAFCPLITLLPANGDYCSEYSEQKCNQCTRLAKLSPHWARKESMGRLFKAASRITVPSNDVKERFEKVFQDIDFVVVPHRERRTCLYQPVISNEKSNGEFVTIAIIGAISIQKGFNVILDISNVITEQRLPVKLVVIGTSCNNSLLKKHGVVVTGKYSSEQEVYDQLNIHNVSAIFLPAICPETYSYTCSIALRTEKPTFVFDVGAPAERLRNLNLEEFIIPLNLKNNPEILIETLLNKIKQGKNIKYYFDDYSPKVSDYYPEI